MGERNLGSGSAPKWLIRYNSRELPVVVRALVGIVGIYEYGN